MPSSPPKLVSSVLARALSHPTRVRAMAVLMERDATPSEVAAELGEPLSNVGYHIDVLEELGVVELVEERPVHGGRVVEHRFRAVDRGYVNLEEWEQFGEREKLTLTSTLMRLISEDVADAMAAGTFFDPDDNHLSRTPMTVDVKGWEEASELLKETLDRLLEIETNVAARAGEDGDQALSMKVMMLQFRSPTKH